jgi:hypothetical protein
VSSGRGVRGVVVAKNSDKQMHWKNVCAALAVVLQAELFAAAI